MRMFSEAKNGQRKRIISSGVIIFLLIVLLVLLKFFYPSSSRMASGEDWRKDPLKIPLQKQSYLINDSLPQYEYRRKLDSLKRELFEENLSSGGSGWNISSIGVEEIEKRNGQKSYYLHVLGYFARDFFEKYSLHGKNYIEDFTVEKKDKDGMESGQLNTTETNLKIDQQDTREWQIGFPISKSQYNFFSSAVLGLIYFVGILILCAEIFLPLKFLFLIANGKAFSLQAIKCLNLIAMILIFSAVLQPLIRLGFHLYFKSQVPHPLTFYYYDDIMSGWTLLVAGLIVLLFAKAFRHGYELQQEQDLTV